METPKIAIFQSDKPQIKIQNLDGNSQSDPNNVFSENYPQIFYHSTSTKCGYGRRDTRSSARRTCFHLKMIDWKLYSREMATTIRVGDNEGDGAGRYLHRTRPARRQLRPDPSNGDGDDDDDDCANRHLIHKEFAGKCAF
jgi:hypothetical protein